MDQEIGRLLAALPGGAERWLIAAVGDHGESLGEHGERNHGLFLYHSTLHVPLILAGPREPAPLLRAGHVLQRKGDRNGARQYMEKVIAIAPGSVEAREAALSRPPL